MSDRPTTPAAPEPAGDAGESLPGWMADALRRPVAVDPARAARIMALVRQAPRPRRSSVWPLAPHRPRWATRRGVLAPGGGAVLAALLTAVLWVARVGDVRPGAVPGAMSATVLRDTVLGDALRDTMHIVRLVLAAPNAAQVAVASATGGDVVPLHRDARTGAWVATVVVPRDAVRLDLVVDGRPVRGPAVAAERPADPMASTPLPGDTI